MTGNCKPTFLRFFINGRNLLRYFKQRYHDVYANVVDTLIEGLKIGKEKVILMKLQNVELRMICLSLGVWWNVTQSEGEYGRISKQSTGRYEGTVGGWSNGDSLPSPLAIYTQSVYPKRVIRNLYATPPSLFVPSVPLRHCLCIRPSATLCALLYKTFSLSPHISEEAVFCT